VADRLFVDVRRFAIPPGRAIGSEHVERRPRRVTVASLLRLVLGVRARPAGDADQLLAYLGDAQPRSVRGTT
jgi:hypothetical protein